jgi:hypothetical protein
LRCGTVLVLVGLLLGSLLAGGCGKAASPGDAAFPTDDAYGRALGGLCLARDQAEREPGRVRTTFFDRSHDTLHVLARELARVDRARTARLLEAKNVVEVELRSGSPPLSLSADLDRLITATRAALTRLDHPAPGCRA